VGKTVSQFIANYKFHIVCFIMGAILSAICIFTAARNITNTELTNLYSQITSFGSTISELRANYKLLEADKNGVDKTNRDLTKSNNDRQAIIDRLTKAERDRQIAIDAAAKAAGQIGIGLDSTAEDIRQARQGIQSTIGDLSKSIDILQNPYGTK
jgi:prefoldin subunit 5